LQEILKNRSFMTVWTASFISGLGDKIAIIALFSLILDRTGSVADLGLLAAAQILPGVLLGPVAGIVIDRWSRRGMMIAGDLLGAAAVLIIPFCRDLWPVYALAAVLSVGRQFSGPARMALIPDIVGKEQLGQSNALAMFSQNIILLLGMAAGGVIVQTMGIRAAFMIDGGTFVLSAAILGARRLVYLDTRSATEQVREKLGDILAGAACLWRHTRLRFAVIFLGVTTAITAMQPPLVFGFVRNTLGRSESELGLIFAAAGVGGLLGAGLAVLMRSTRPMSIVTLMIACDGALLLLFAVNRNPAMAALLFGLFGAVSTVIQVNLATFLQTETPREMRGRIFGWLTPLLGPISLISVLVGPGLTRLAGAATILAFAGGAEVLIGTIGRISLPAIDGSGASTPLPEDPDDAGGPMVKKELQAEA
jgi:MFS family permease